jgi:YVTN family beta-propeller protein
LPRTHRLDSPSHGIGVSPDNKTLWVTSILANGVFAYDLGDMKIKGFVKLPEIRVPGRNPMSAVPNWVTFTPDGKEIYISNAAHNSVSAIDTQSGAASTAVATARTSPRNTIFPPLLRSMLFTLGRHNTQSGPARKGQRFA